MICHAWTVVCEKSIIDRETNNVSIDILEELTVTDIPSGADAVILVPTQVTIVSLWYRTDIEQGATARGRLTYLSPNNEELGRSEFDINVQEYRRYRTRIKLNMLPVKGAGQYFFRIELNADNEWREVGRVPLQINIPPRANDAPRQP